MVVISARASRVSWCIGGKRRLEEIYLTLQYSDTVSLNEKKRILTNLSSNEGVVACPPGVLTNLENAVIELKADWPTLLMNSRLSIVEYHAIQYYAQEEAKKDPSRRGGRIMQTHYVSALRNSVAAFFGIPKTNDGYENRNFPLSEFRDKIFAEMNFSAILAAIHSKGVATHLADLRKNIATQKVELAKLQDEKSKIPRNSREQSPKEKIQRDIAKELQLFQGKLDGLGTDENYATHEFYNVSYDESYQPSYTERSEQEIQFSAQCTLIQRLWNEKYLTENTIREISLDTHKLMLIPEALACSWVQRPIEHGEPRQSLQQFLTAEKNKPHRARVCKELEAILNQSNTLTAEQIFGLQKVIFLFGEVGKPEWTVYAKNILEQSKDLYSLLLDMPTDNRAAFLASTSAETVLYSLVDNPSTLKEILSLLNEDEQGKFLEQFGQNSINRLLTVLEYLPEVERQGFLQRESIKSRIGRLIADSDDLNSLLSLLPENQRLTFLTENWDVIKLKLTNAWSVYRYLKKILVWLCPSDQSDFLDKIKASFDVINNADSLATLLCCSPKKYPSLWSFLGEAGKFKLISNAQTLGTVLSKISARDSDRCQDYKKDDTVWSEFLENAPLDLCDLIKDLDSLCSVLSELPKRHRKYFCDLLWENQNNKNRSLFDLATCPVVLGSSLLFFPGPADLKKFLLLFPDEDDRNSVLDIGSLLKFIEKDIDYLLVVLFCLRQDNFGRGFFTRENVSILQDAFIHLPAEKYDEFLNFSIVQCALNALLSDDPKLTNIISSLSKEQRKTFFASSVIQEKLVKSFTLPDSQSLRCFFNLPEKKRAQVFTSPGMQKVLKRAVDEKSIWNILRSLDSSKQRFEFFKYNVDEINFPVRIGLVLANLDTEEYSPFIEFLSEHRKFENLITDLSDLDVILSELTRKQREAFLGLPKVEAILDRLTKDFDMSGALVILVKDRWSFLLKTPNFREKLTVIDRLFLNIHEAISAKDSQRALLCLAQLHEYRSQNPQAQYSQKLWKGMQFENEYHTYTSLNEIIEGLSFRMPGNFLVAALFISNLVTVKVLLIIEMRASKSVKKNYLILLNQNSFPTPLSEKISKI